MYQQPLIKINGAKAANVTLQSFLCFVFFARNNKKSVSMKITLKQLRHTYLYLVSSGEYLAFALNITCTGKIQ